MSFSRRTLALAAAVATSGAVIPGAALAATSAAPAKTTSVTSTAGRYVSAPRATLHHGDRGPTVAELQRFLNLYLPVKATKIPVTGYFGTQTLAAVKDVQRHYRITVDGVVGPLTWRMIAPAD